MWNRLGGLSGTVLSGLDEFRKEALRESTSLIREAEAKAVNVVGIARRGSTPEKHAGDDSSERRVDQDLGAPKGFEEGAAAVPAGSGFERPSVAPTESREESGDDGQETAQPSGKDPSIVEVEVPAQGATLATDQQDQESNKELSAGENTVADLSSERGVAEDTRQDLIQAEVGRNGSSEAGEAQDAQGVEAEGVEVWQLRCNQLERALEQAEVQHAELAAQLSNYERGVNMEAKVEVLELERQLAAAKAEAAAKELQAAAAQKKQEVMEERVKALAGTLEQRMNSLRNELEVRTGEVQELRDENSGLAAALGELRQMLKESVAEREKMAQKRDEERQALEKAKEEHGRLQQQAESAARECAEAVAEAADAQAELRALKDAVASKALGTDERQSLEKALQELSSSAQAAAAEAGKWQAAAEGLEGEVAQLKEALSAAEAASAAAQQRALEAELAAEEACQRASVAEVSKEELAKQSEQRSRVFKSAVKAAVSRIQAELEAERDAALARVAVLQGEATEQQAALRQAQARCSALEGEVAAAVVALRAREGGLAEAQQRAEDLAGQLASAQAEASTAAKQAEEAKALSQSLAEQVAAQEGALAEAAAVGQQRRDAEAALQREVKRMGLALQAAEQERNTFKVAGLEAASRAAEEVGRARARIAELEGQLSGMEVRLAQRGRVDGSPARSSSGRNWGGSGLEDLGLEGVRWKEKLKQSEHDVEASAESRPLRLTKRGAVAAHSVTSRVPLLRGLLRRIDGHSEFEQDAAPRSGAISVRSGLVLAYLFILHIMVMVSFTSRSAPALCIDAGNDLRSQLPG